LNKGVFHHVRSSFNRCIQNYIVSAPLDLSRSPVHLADSLSAIESLSYASDSQRNVVSLNATVTVKDLLTCDVADFTLVNSKESLLKAGQLSYLSPLGSRLFGSRVGDKVTMGFMGYRVDLQVLSITYT
jgi:transcription elongation GreA/GreB family factor